MDKLRIIARDVELDLFEEQVLSFNYQIEDITEPQKKKTSFSKTIKLPGTKKNNQFFANVYDVNIDGVLSFNPLKSIPVNVLVGGLEDTKLQNLQLLNINDDNGVITYEVSLSANLKSVFNQITDEPLNALDFSEYNHTRNITNIVNSHDYNCVVYGTNIDLQEPGRGYVYPYIVYGKNSTIEDNVVIDDLNPAIYLKEVFDKIMASTDFTYTSSFLNSDYFKKIIIPFNEGTLQRTAEETENIKVVVGLDVVSKTLVSRIDFWTAKQDEYVSLPNETGTISDIEFGDNLSQWNGQLLTVENAGLYNLTFNMPSRLKFYRDSGSNIDYRTGDLDIVTLIEKQAVGTTSWVSIVDNVIEHIPIGLQSAGLVSSPYLDNTVINLNLVKDNVYLNSGDKLRVRIYCRASNIYFVLPTKNEKVKIDLIGYKNIGDDVARFSMESASNDTYGEYDINMNQILSKEIKQKDLFLQIVKMFNLYIDDDPKKKNNLLIEPRDEFYGSRTRVLDWDKKVDRDDTIKLTPMSEIDSKEFKYTYKEDNDYYNDKYRQMYNRGYGDLTINIQNDFSNKVDKLELDFAATPVSDNLINDRVAPFFCDFEEDLLKPKKVKPRLLFYTGKVPCDNWYLKQNQSATNTDSSTQELNYYPACGMYDDPNNPENDLSFGYVSQLYYNATTVPVNNLYEKFHKTQFEEITDINSKLMECSVYLTEEDIQTLDFRDLIFIDGQYWRLQKIKDYSPLVPRTTKVVLSKLKNVNLIQPHVAEVPVSNKACPVDVYYDIRSNTYRSKRSTISADCCKQLRGVYKSGMCYVPGRKDGQDTIEDKDRADEVRDLKLNDAIAKSDKTRTEEVRDESYVKNTNVIRRGERHSINSASRNLMVMGNDITNPRPVQNTIVVGDNIQTTESNSIYIGNVRIDEDGQIINDKTYIIDSGEDTVMAVNKTNLIDIIDGGVDSVRNYGGDNKTRPIIDGSNKDN